MLITEMNKKEERRKKDLIKMKQLMVINGDNNGLIGKQQRNEHGLFVVVAEDETLTDDNEHDWNYSKSLNRQFFR